jgi:hypothetical protein
MLRAFLILLVTLVSFTHPCRAQAQQQDERPDPESYDAKSQTVHPGKIFLSLMRQPGLSEDQAVLHMAINAVMSGCPKLGNLWSSSNISGERLTIEVGDYSMDMHDLPRDAQAKCGHMQQTPSADTVLSKDDLAGVTTLELINGKMRDFYDLQVSDEQISLSPGMMTNGQYFKPLVVSGIKNALTHWIYPDGTLILYAPDAAPDSPGGGAVATAVDAAAQQMGLVPLDQAYTDFTSPLAAPGYFYYVDVDGKIAPGVPDDSEKRIGSIVTTRTVYGLDADKKVSRSVALFARHPRAYE